MSVPDPCFEKLLNHPRAQIRAPEPETSMAHVREALDAPLRAIVGEAVCQVADLVAEDGPYRVPLRLYRPSSDGAPGPVMIFIHGGGFVAGSRDTHDAICRAFCRESGVNILSVDYRLAPEHPYPAAVDDCRAVLRWIARRGERHGLDPARLAICGDSAGGYIALTTALAAQQFPADAPPIRYVALIYPVVDPACDTPSMMDFSEGYVLTRGAMRWFWEAFAGPTSPDHTILSLLRRDLSGLPPVSILTAEFDPLRDEGEALHRTLAAAGVRAMLRRYPGMIHGFASLLPLTPVAGQAIRDLVGEILPSLSSAGGNPT